MSWGSNWGFSDPSAPSQSAVKSFSWTGGLGTKRDKAKCKKSNDCASGYACSGGLCVPISQEKGTDGTLSGCGSEGGGACNSLTDSKVGGGGDGCTVSACGVVECGDPDSIDCPGDRKCRYNASGVVNCLCNSSGGYDPSSPPGSPIGSQDSCSEFCTSFKQSVGTDADGCTGLSCDECEFCESTSGTCLSTQSGPCHCNPDQLPECVKCSEDGTQVTDGDCLKCVDVVNQPCSCNPDIIVSKRCCYPLSSWASGLSPVNRCQQELQEDCQPQCDEEPPYVDPCLGTCTDHITCDVTCPSPPAPPPGTDQTVTGQIEVPGKCCTLYTECTDKPDCDECKANGDCSTCQRCRDGKCEADPACGDKGRSTWYKAAIPFSYEGCAPGTGCAGGGPAISAPVNKTSGCGKLPHSIVTTKTMDQTTIDGCTVGDTTTCWRVVDADGNFISNQFCQSGVGGYFCGGPDTSSPPGIVSVEYC